MSSYRIDRTIIKMIESGPSIKGGQGTVLIGTIMSPGEAIPERLSKELPNANYAVKKLQLNLADLDESVKRFKVRLSVLSYAVCTVLIVLSVVHQRA